MYRVVTVAREFGSSGAAIAALMAARLNWKLLDRALLEEIARSAHVDPSLAARFDECVDPWLHRLAKQALWRGAIEAVAAVGRDDFFDSEAMARFGSQVIRDAAEIGNCVIVGRGAQCVLEGQAGVFHVFVYGPLQEKIARLRRRFPAERDPEALLRDMDRRRAAYIREYFQRDWCDRYLYNLMLNSHCGEQAAAQSILCAAGLGATRD